MKPLLSQGAVICSFYLKTGTCKFGATCKFDHPPPGEAIAMVTSQGSGSGTWTGVSSTESGENKDAAACWGTALRGQFFSAFVGQRLLWAASSFWGFSLSLKTIITLLDYLTNLINPAVFGKHCCLFGYQPTILWYVFSYAERRVSLFLLYPAWGGQVISRRVTLLSCGMLGVCMSIN